MSMNKYMHPRNIYKQPPNFKQLAIDFPEFRQYAKQDITGKISIDFKDINALRALTLTLLKKDFGLNVDIPLDRLIPTIPLRLNYILWIEDLISISLNRSDNKIVRGIDIGTGSSCVYPLIIAKKNRWKMLGTESESASFNYAQKNVINNNLEDLISLKQVSQDTVLNGVLENEEYDFCMCNPPFFASTNELNPFFKSRTNRRALPRNANTGFSKELITKGGEVEFVTKIIRESAEIKSQIRIYSTMLGQKSSLPPLKALLRAVDITSFKQTEFCQGRTTRWGLSWTFCPIDLRKIPQDTLAASRKKPNTSLKYLIPSADNADYKLESIVSKVQDLLTSLEMEVLKCAAAGKYAFDVTASKETWTNQRRKRREQTRLQQSSFSDSRASTSTPTPDSSLSDDSAQKLNNSSCSGSPSGVTETAHLLSAIDVGGDARKQTQQQQHAKRELEEEDEGYCNVKKLKLMDDATDAGGGGGGGGATKFVLKCTVAVYKADADIFLEMRLSNGSSCSKDCLHQLLQYFKNNLK